MTDPGSDRSTFREAFALLRRVLRWAVRSYLLVLVLGIVIGLQVAPIASSFVAKQSRGSVAVVPLSGGIDGQNAMSVASRIERAQRNPSIDAIVLWINSPGGGASASESIYLQVKQAAKEMPVVVSADSLVASGGYYAAAGADEIYVKPSTLIGSVGVFFSAPTDPEPIGGLITSGPNKLSGADKREWFYKTEAIKRAFVSAVLSNRGERLELTRQQLAYAKLYTGSEAVANGMADGIGGLETAIARAAEMANLDRYRVEFLPYRQEVQFLTKTTYIAANTTQKELISPSRFLDPPSETVAPNVVMLPPSVVRAAITDDTGNVSPITEVTTNETASP